MRLAHTSPKHLREALQIPINNFHFAVGTKWKLKDFQVEEGKDLKGNAHFT